MSKQKYAMVMDLNKCLGCQTCTIACKKLWTDRDGTGYMYWPRSSNSTFCAAISTSARFAPALKTSP